MDIAKGEEEKAVQTRFEPAESNGYKLVVGVAKAAAKPSHDAQHMVSVANGKILRVAALNNIARGQLKCLGNCGAWFLVKKR
ncbi:MAG: hypothetical protein NTX73_01555 [Rhodobacterales bacterium]|nr:hypothetical protein [Rhodobacterales bacterium]